MLGRLAWKAVATLGRPASTSQHGALRSFLVCNQSRLISNQIRPSPLIRASILQCYDSIQNHNSSGTTLHRPLGPSTSSNAQWVRHFHARGSKVRYMDFRYKFNTSHYKSHLIIIRRQKMKKHQRTKWRKKFKCLLAKKRLKREIVKEKTFRVELLTMIKRAEQFDPKEYALRKINEANNAPRKPTREERIEELKELIRTHRYQVDYIKPKHKRIQTLSDFR